MPFFFSISSYGPKNRMEKHWAKQEVQRKETSLKWMTHALE
jgi:hypothetical protein